MALCFFFCLVLKVLRYAWLARAMNMSMNISWRLYGLIKTNQPIVNASCVPDMQVVLFPVNPISALDPGKD